MSDDGSNGILGKIYSLQIDQSKQLGQMEGRFDILEDGIKSIKTQCSLCTAAVHDVGKKAAIHDAQLERHEKKLSDVFRRLEIDETSQVIHVTQEKTRWGTLRIIGAIILGALALASGIGGLTAMTQQSAAKQAAINEGVRK